MEGGPPVRRRGIVLQHGVLRAHLSNRHTLPRVWDRLTGLVEEDRDVLIRVVEQGKEHVHLRNGVVGTAYGEEVSTTPSHRQVTDVPVCPLTPRAAPVAVNNTIASRII